MATPRWSISLRTGSSRPSAVAAVITSPSSTGVLSVVTPTRRAPLGCRRRRGRAARQRVRVRSVGYLPVPYAWIPSASAKAYPRADRPVSRGPHASRLRDALRLAVVRDALRLATCASAGRHSPIDISPYRSRAGARASSTIRTRPGVPASRRSDSSIEGACDAVGHDPIPGQWRIRRVRSMLTRHPL